MLSSIKQRLDREDDGFTLIELMVVVLIIAILLAIAIPTFLGARNSANARSAQSNLRNALTAEQTEWTNNQTFSQDTTTAGMKGVEGSLAWTTAAPTAGNAVSVAAGDPDASGNDQAVAMEAFGKDGNCYVILQSNDPTNSFTGYAVTKQAANACAAPTVPTISTTTVASGSASAHPAATPTSTLSYYTSW